MPIKTFKGKIASSDMQMINLHTNNGSTGYRIKKLELFPASPGSTSYEIVFKVFKVSQVANDYAGTNLFGIVDFSDQTLLAAAYLEGNNANNATDGSNVVFDNEIFNQDITITSVDNDGNTEAVNYYIELEQVKLDLNENTVATLKNIRNITG
tara:strand:+ start:1488 stop:1946 length:459 start_codon:yes stop_codon:yes gene_type:complete